MKITIASGKGGTGKTIIATNLAHTFASLNHEVSYLDCDVEEPDGHLFLKLAEEKREVVQLKAPVRIDSEKCTGCGRCAENCNYNAIAVMKGQTMIFPELCHVCGACSIVCPEDAIIEDERKIGDLIQGKSGDINVHYALLQCGEGGMSPRLIKKVKTFANSEFNILDSPPGTACSAVETIKKSDLVILVTDPTPFGVNDLKLSVQMCRTLGIEPVVLVNRAKYRDDKLKKYCREAELDIIGELPDDRKVAEVYSEGKLITVEIPEYERRFKKIVFRIKELLVKERKVKKEVIPVFKKNKKIAKSKTSRSEGGGKPTELVIISGKGGTGKTSIAASFAALTQNTVITDCDVDASDLHLILKPEIKESGYFSGSYQAIINQNNCVFCGQCRQACSFNAIDEVIENKKKQYKIDPFICEGCGVCALVCKFKAIELSDAINGEWYISETRFGPMVHARLGMAEENSGRLVSLTRNNEALIASKNNYHRAIIDGSPGTGCPVIASLTGSEYALIITEPTVSGIYDLERILEVTRHFNIESGVVVNKAGINPKMAQKIKNRVKAEEKVTYLGEIPYDDKITEAQMQQQSIIEYAPDCLTSRKIKTIFNTLKKRVFKKNNQKLLTYAQKSCIILL